MDFFQIIITVLWNEKLTRLIGPNMCLAITYYHLPCRPDSQSPLKAEVRRAASKISTPPSSNYTHVGGGNGQCRVPGPAHSKHAVHWGKCKTLPMVFAALALYSSFSRFLSSVPPTRAPSSILFSQQLSLRNHHVHCLCPPHPICLSSDTGSVRTFPSYSGDLVR